MKLFYTYFLIFTFVTRPLFSVANYAYYALNIDYIIETYCINTDKPELACNGKCHLAKQLQNSNDNTQTNNVKLLSETFLPVFFQNNALVNFPILEILELQNDIFPISLYRFDVNSNVFKPPIV
ncbi:hypothetical protein C7H62_0183 [Mesoflavibacter sp. HG96]|uniref:hypothetical protein n=1 Tax=Mesoflavibacter TaxID=444051 RepID=UPI000D10870A|nr:MULTISPECIES: hypothetical protein [Mesoflavibacter]QIJ87993.1 hypothetical protein C7H62_0183 [Mesoflavibacter sp. HG96]QIJ90721.1 hypothetical protein C7H56_0183 [Mesoflavibacter sp. HG37]